MKVKTTQPSKTGVAARAEKEAKKSAKDAEKNEQQQKKKALKKFLREEKKDKENRKRGNIRKQDTTKEKVLSVRKGKDRPKKGALRKNSEVVNKGQIIISSDIPGIDIEKLQQVAEAALPGKNESTSYDDEIKLVVNGMTLLLKKKESQEDSVANAFSELNDSNNALDSDPNAIDVEVPEEVTKDHKRPPIGKGHKEESEVERSKRILGDENIGTQTYEGSVVSEYTAMIEIGDDNHSTMYQVDDCSLPTRRKHKNNVETEDHIYGRNFSDEDDTEMKKGEALWREKEEYDRFVDSKYDNEEHGFFIVGQEGVKDVEIPVNQHIDYEGDELVLQTLNIPTVIETVGDVKQAIDKVKADLKTAQETEEYEPEDDKSVFTSFKLNNRSWVFPTMVEEGDGFQTQVLNVGKKMARKPKTSESTKSKIDAKKDEVREGKVTRAKVHKNKSTKISSDENQMGGTEDHSNVENEGQNALNTEGRVHSAECYNPVEELRTQRNSPNKVWSSDRESNDYSNKLEDAVVIDENLQEKNIPKVVCHNESSSNSSVISGLTRMPKKRRKKKKMTSSKEAGTSSNKRSLLDENSGHFSHDPSAPSKTITSGKTERVKNTSNPTNNV